MAQTIRFQCPVCEAELTASPAQAGEKMNCPKCSQRLQIPHLQLQRPATAALDPTAGSPPRPATPARTANAAVSPPLAMPVNPEAWYWMLGGNRQGPVTFPELQKRAAAKEIGPNQSIWHPSLQKWMPAESITGLFQTAPLSPAGWVARPASTAIPGSIDVPAPTRAASSTQPGPAPITKPSPSRIPWSSRYRKILVAAGVAGLGGICVIGIGACLLFALVSWPKGSPTTAPVVAGPLTSDQIFARHAPSVCVIKTSQGNGSGFLAAPGIVATNAHVIKDSPIERLRVYFPSSTTKEKEPVRVGYVLYEDRKLDLALLSVSSDLPSLVIADDYVFQAGENVLAIGSPAVGDGERVLENAVSQGVMSTKVREAFTK